MENDLRVTLGNRRYYRNPVLGGKLSPSVTEIVNSTASHGLMEWAARQAAEHALKNLQAPGGRPAHIREAVAQPRREMQYHAQIGTDVHARLWTGEREGLLPEVTNALTSWDMFLEDTGAVCIAEEQQLAGVIGPEDRVGYGGTYDSIIELPNGKRILIDVKSSRLIHNVYAMQLAAYWYLLEEEVDELWIVHVNKLYPWYGIREVEPNQAMLAFTMSHALYALTNQGLWKW